MNKIFDFFQNKTGPVTRALLALFFVFVIGAIFNADRAFFSLDAHRDTMRMAAVWGILATGMTLVIITGGIDLSVGSILAVASVSFSLFTMHWQWSAWLAIPVVLAIGAVCGTVSGGLVSKLKIQPFIATLAMMVFARGVAKGITGGQKVSTAVKLPDGSYEYVNEPAIFGIIDRQILWGNLTVVAVIFFVGLAVAWILLSRHRWGRYLYAIGGNEEAARLSGVPVVLSKTLAYTLCGFYAALAGICEASQTKLGDTEAGQGLELTAISMVVIGGTSLAGGRGGMALTLLGVLIIGYVDKILSLNAAPPAVRLMLTGCIIVIAVLAQRKR